jgi:hypothetical protein
MLGALAEDQAEARCGTAHERFVEEEGGEGGGRRTRPSIIEAVVALKRWCV